MKTWQKLKGDSALREHYAQRSVITKAIRDYFWEQAFLEVETPQLVALPSMEPYLEVFETQLIDESRAQYRGFLTSSPEFAMKKLLASGYTKVFQICKSYRNMEGWSTRHNPEFTILEWYRTQANYEDVMQDCEQLFRFIAKRLGREKLSFRGKQFDLSLPWERISVAQAFQKYAGLDTETILDPTKLLEAAKKKGNVIDERTTWEEAFNQIFLTEIEPHLGENNRPTILFEYPAEMAALSKKSAKDPRFAERFEFYIAGLELGNAFSELTDPVEQLRRLQADRAEKEKLGRTLYDVDLDFISALESGIEDCAGIAVGVDRVAMVFMDATTIQETLFFPAVEMWERSIGP